jgi:hypothetical protein
MTVSFAALRKTVHRKTAEYLAPLPSGNTISGAFLVADKSEIIPGREHVYYVGGTSAVWRYSSDEDSMILLPPSGIAGIFGAGSCGEFRALSCMAGLQTLTATAGTTSTLTTNQTLARNLKGCKIRAVAGAGAGYDGTIDFNTLGANSVITVTPASTVAFGATTQFQVYGGSLWFMNAGTTAVGFAVYDVATNAWNQKSVVGLPTAWSIEGQLIGTEGISSNAGLGFSNGTATSAAATALTDTTKNWPVNGWTNDQVRIKTGTGAGQVRTIASNTANSITVSAAWTINPDATSTYVIEPLLSIVTRLAPMLGPRWLPPPLAQVH